MLKGPEQAWKSVENGPFDTIRQPTCWMDQKEAGGQAWTIMAMAAMPASHVAGQPCGFL